MERVDSSADRELRYIFGEKSAIRTSARFDNCTVCVIKPHLVQEKKVGRVVDMILSAGFEISALELFNLDKPTATEFLEVYRGVLPEYSSIIDHMVSGPCIALEIRQENAVEKFGELCGPHDPEIARALRSGTIRAQFGHDRVRNGVHCTDLPEDGTLESEYFFNILQSK